MNICQSPPKIEATIHQLTCCCGRGGAIVILVHDSQCARHKARYLLIFSVGRLRTDIRLFLRSAGPMGGSHSVAGMPCSSCTPAEHVTTPDPRNVAWRPLFVDRITLTRSSPVAGIVCPGPSIHRLSQEAVQFLSEKTDAWGINTALPAAG